MVSRIGQGRAPVDLGRSGHVGEHPGPYDCLSLNRTHRRLRHQHDSPAVRVLDSNRTVLSPIGVLRFHRRAAEPGQPRDHPFNLRQVFEVEHEQVLAAPVAGVTCEAVKLTRPEPIAVEADDRVELIGRSRDPHAPHRQRGWARLRRHRGPCLRLRSAYRSGQELHHVDVVITVGIARCPAAFGVAESGVEPLARNEWVLRATRSQPRLRISACRFEDWYPGRNHAGHLAPRAVRHSQTRPTSTRTAHRAGHRCRSARPRSANGRHGGLLPRR